MKKEIKEFSFAGTGLSCSQFEKMLNNSLPQIAKLKDEALHDHIFNEDYARDLIDEIIDHLMLAMDDGLVSILEDIISEIPVDQIPNVEIRLNMHPILEAKAIIKK